MFQIVTPKGKFGPYASAEKFDDHYLVGQRKIPFTVIGDGTVEPYDGFLNPDPPQDVEKAKEEAKARLLKLRDEQEQKGFTFNGNEFNGDVNSMLRMVLAGFGLQGAPVNLNWTLKNGATVTLTPAQLKDAIQSAVQRGDAVHSKYRSNLASINAATTVADVAAVDIEAGWPA